jgi:NAD(P)-dependent dehydrogenase (short-subunit alcohol dehydrogenase family)
MNTLNLQLDNKLVVVTGSTSGIGKGIAKSFLQEGAKVIVNGRSQDRVEEVAQELSAFGQVYGIAADVSDASGTHKFIRQVKEHGEVDVLVNNMGVFEVKDFAEVSDEEWMNYFNVNVLSAVRLSRELLPDMLKRNSGRIINIASEAGVKPLPQMIPYSVTKTALISLARGLAELTKGTKVTVNSVLPGPTWTEGVESYMVGAAEAENEELEPFTANYFKKNEPTSLIQRFATVEEVADTVVFIASEKASAINGAAQKVEGGIIRSL